MLVLGLSTSTPRGSAALARDGRVLASVDYVELRTHAERLFPAIDEVCRLAGVEKRHIARVACDIGPGSFTGVRVGVAAAHGIAMSLGIGAVGVLSLEAMAAGAREQPACPSRILCLVDAQKGELYLSGYAASDLRAIVAPEAVSLVDAKRRVTDALTEGWAVVGSALAQIGVSPTFAVRETDLPDAALVAKVGAMRNEPPAVAALEPVYVRAPDAMPSAVVRPEDG